jgi:hypothetical protein
VAVIFSVDDDPDVGAGVDRDREELAGERSIGGRGSASSSSAIFASRGLILAGGGVCFVMVLLSPSAVCSVEGVK